MLSTSAGKNVLGIIFSVIKFLSCVLRVGFLCCMRTNSALNITQGSLLYKITIPFFIDFKPIFQIKKIRTYFEKSQLISALCEFKSISKIILKEMQRKIKSK